MSTKKFSEENKFIGKILKQVRLSKNMTLKEFGGVVDMSPGYLSEVERGLKLPGSELFISLKRMMGIDIDMFFSFKEAGIETNEPNIPYVYDDRLKNLRGRIQKSDASPEEKMEMLELLLDIYEEKSE